MILNTFCTLTHPNDLTFTKTRELVHFPKYAEPHLSRFVDFIIDLSLSQVPIIKAG